RRGILGPARVAAATPRRVPGLAGVRCDRAAAAGISRPRRRNGARPRRDGMKMKHTDRSRSGRSRWSWRACWSWHAWLACLALAVMASPARASFETYIVDELYSNADGTVQYLLLRENQGLNQQDVLLAQTLAATHAGVTQTYVFDHNLPSKLTANKHVLVASAGFVARNAIVPDYVMPNRFLPIDGGTITYAGIDRVTYDSLPTDGVRALFRAAIVAPNVAINFFGATASVPPLPVTAVEFYNPQLDHYFVSALAADIDALDTGRIPGWYRTGQTFRVYPSAAAAGGAASPVCRFYIPPQHGDSHFLSAAPAECSAIAQRIGVDPNYSGYILESPAVFYVLLPD